MTKTLTEQWRDGTLESGHYYIQWSFDCDPRPRNMIDFFDKEYSDGGEFMLQQHKYIDEVLAPVPSYDEYKKLVSNSDELILTLQKMVEDECSRRCELETKCSQLEKELSRKTLQLEIATKALDHCQGFDFVQYALKEMEGVK